MALEQPASDVEVVDVPLNLGYGERSAPGNIRFEP